MLWGHFRAKRLVLNRAGQLPFHYTPNLGSNTISNPKNKFAILLATWNGEKFLGEQLASLANQTADHVDLWISDDGSKDSTIAIVTKFAKAWEKGQCKVFNHVRQSTLDPSLPAAGSNENFRSLLMNRDRPVNQPCRR